MIPRDLDPIDAMDTLLTWTRQGISPTDYAAQWQAAIAFLDADMPASLRCSERQYDTKPAIPRQLSAIDAEDALHAWTLLNIDPYDSAAHWKAAIAFVEAEMPNSMRVSVRKRRGVG